MPEAGRIENATHNFPPQRVKLTDAEVTELCTAGAAAWDQLGPKGRVARFEWRGRKYRALHTTFRLQIQSGDGRRLIAQRWD